MFSYKIFDDLPDFLTQSTLIKLGLYSNRDALYFARIRGNGPNFIKLGRRIVYPKKDIVSFLEKNSFKGNIPYQPPLVPNES